MLQPKRQNYRKSFRGRRKGIVSRGYELSFGEYGLKALETCWMKASQIEAIRRAITGDFKRKGRLWLRVFPDKSVTSRAAGQRMGGGKGDISHYVVVVRPGKIILEVGGVSREVAESAFAKANAKLPFKTKLVSRE